MSVDVAPSQLGDDIIWGATAIGTELGIGRRKTFYLLEKGLLPATKVGREWVTTRSALRDFFADTKTGKAA